MPAARPTVGVLALQGAFARHARVLASLGADAREIRTPDDLTSLDAVVLPGGESTTMSMLLESSGLFEPLAERLADGLPVLGTCAGMILLATEVIDGRADQRSFGAIDMAVRRNGYGRQVDSFETDLAIAALDADAHDDRERHADADHDRNGNGREPFHAVFIRAPLVERVGADVEVLATHDDHPVLARSGHITVASFHPELSGDARLHAQFMKEL